MPGPSRARGERGGLLAVTTRPAIRQRLADVAAGLALPPPTFVPVVGDVLESGADCATLLLDLGSCYADPMLPVVVGTWAMLRPASEVVLFTPLLDREAELRAAARLLTTVRDADLRVMTASEFYSDEAWRSLAALRERAVLEAELRTEFLDAVRKTGRALPAEPIVLELLHHAPGDPYRAPADQAARGRAGGGLDRARKLRWRLLRRAGQLPASWLLLVFRMLWYLKLRDRRWRAGRIAMFLGYPSARHLRRTVRRRLGARMRDLARIRYHDALAWAANLVTSAPTRVARWYIRTLFDSLFDTAHLGPDTTATAERAGRPSQSGRRRGTRARRPGPDAPTSGPGRESRA